MVTDSVVVFVVRDGNPKKIKGWNDLLKPDVEVITPNPFTSGGARWNIMAAYGAQRRAGKTDKQAQRLPAEAVQERRRCRTRARASRCRRSSRGKGDVLLAYENEAIFAQSKRPGLQFVIPRQTILIENPVAVLKTSEHKADGEGVPRASCASRPRSASSPRTATARCCKSVARGVQDAVPGARPACSRSTTSWLGGWDKVQKRFFDPQHGIMAQIQRQVGGDTG